MLTRFDFRNRPAIGAPKRAIIAGALALLVLVVPQSTGAADTERVFREASQYTVKIRARIETAFIEDEAGVNEGAGFLVDVERGWIVTNAHVIGHSPSTISAAFRDGPFINAKKVFVDPYLDLAVLAVEDIDGERTAAPLDCDKNPPIGHPVGAFGHPWGLDFTGTRGIVSGVIKGGEGTFIGMDAAINPGNSGGPLISLSTGQVVGINTASLDEEDDQNTNFAIPMTFVCRVLGIAQWGGDPSPPNLPVKFMEPLRDRDALIVARSYLREGLLDLQRGDEILNLDGGEPITSEADLIHALRGRLEDVRLNVLRAGESISIRGRLTPTPLVTERPGVLVSGLLLGPSVFRDSAVLGQDNGLMVHDVERGSAGDDHEFDYWDILTTIDGKQYDDPSELYLALQDAQEEGRSVSIEILRISEGVAFFDYLQRELPIEGLELISSPKKEARSSPPTPSFVGSSGVWGVTTDRNGTSNASTTKLLDRLPSAGAVLVPDSELEESRQ